MGFDKEQIILFDDENLDISYGKINDAIASYKKNPEIMKEFYERKGKIKRNKIMLVSMIGIVSLLSLLYFFNYTTDYAYTLEKSIGFDYKSAFKNLTSPENISIDTLGNIYVLEAGKDRIQKFTNNGTFLLEWGDIGSDLGQFSNPTGVSADSGNVYVADSRNDRIQKYTGDGKLLKLWTF